MFPKRKIKAEKVSRRKEGRLQSDKGRRLSPRHETRLRELSPARVRLVIQSWLLKSDSAFSKSPRVNLCLSLEPVANHTLLSACNSASSSP